MGSSNSPFQDPPHLSQKQCYSDFHKPLKVRYWRKPKQILQKGFEFLQISLSRYVGGHWPSLRRDTKEGEAWTQQPLLAIKMLLTAQAYICSEGEYHVQFLKTFLAYFPVLMKVRGERFSLEVTAARYASNDVSELFSTNIILSWFACL